MNINKYIYIYMRVCVCTSICIYIYIYICMYIKCHFQVQYSLRVPLKGPQGDIGPHKAYMWLCWDHPGL